MAKEGTEGSSQLVWPIQSLLSTQIIIYMENPEPSCGSLCNHLVFWRVYIYVQCQRGKRHDDAVSLVHIIDELSSN